LYLNRFKHETTIRRTRCNVRLMVRASRK